MFIGLGTCNSYLILTPPPYIRVILESLYVVFIEVRAIIIAEIFYIHGYYKFAILKLLVKDGQSSLNNE